MRRVRGPAVLPVAVAVALSALVPVAALTRTVGASDPQLPAAPSLGSGPAAHGAVPRTTPATGLAAAPFSWGDNSVGQLGQGITTVPIISTPGRVLAPAVFSSVSAGSRHTLALDSEGQVWAWGDDTFGELGDGNNSSTPDPQLVPLPSGTICTAVAAGVDDSFALTSTGTVYAWGLNSDGQLGDGTTINRSTPVPVDLPVGVSITGISAGGFDTVALGSDGTVYTWGANASGQLGNGTETPNPIPGAVTTPAGQQFTAVSAGGTFDLALTAAGTVYGWGSNGNGQLGNDTITNSPVPVPTTPVGVQFTQIAAGGISALALTSTGTVYSWGDNDLGQLGQGNTTDSYTPAPVDLPVFEPYVGIAAGFGDGYALSATGVVWAWGSDQYGQLGDGATVNRVDPVRVLGPAGTTAAGVFAGSSGSHAALVTALDQTISFPAIPDQTYGVAPFAPPATSTSGLPLTYSASGNCTYRNSQVFVTGAGGCELTASQAGTNQYNPAAPVQATFHIAQVGLTLNALPATGTVGHLPTLGYSLTGFVNKDTTATMTGSASCTTTATVASPVGRYPITCTAGSLTSPNYFIAQTVPAVLAINPAAQGYALIGVDGSVYVEGPKAGSGQLGVHWLGSANAHPLNAPIVGAAFTPDKNGYWLLGGDGGIFAFGDAGFYGSTGSLTLNKPIVGMAPTPDGRGYWLVAADGGIFAFGDAGFHGSTGSLTLNKPIVGMAPTPDGRGYWLVAADGGIFAFGDAGFHGSTGAYNLTQSVVGIASSADGQGYWLVTSGGDVFAFGSAPFEGDLRYVPVSQPIVGLVPTADGLGYTLAGSDGSVFTFGDAPFFGTLVGGPSHAPIATII